MKPIRLTNEEYDSIRVRKNYIGSGVDGSVFKIDKNTIYKFYHRTDYLTILPNPILDKDGVIINDFKSLRPFSVKRNPEGVYYTDDEGVILTREEALYKAIEKQKNVLNTDLPKNIIYLNGKAIGCEYRYYPHKLGIYAAAYLPLKQRLIVCNRLIGKVRELLVNSIYPVTLAQRDDVFPFKRDNSNVLLGIDLDPTIIDLDGISTIYSDKQSNVYYKKTLESLSSLILEILTKVELADLKEDDEYIINEFVNRMKNAGISSFFAEKYFDNNRLEMDDLVHIVKSLEKRKK